MKVKSQEILSQVLGSDLLHPELRAKLAMLAYFAGSSDACGLIKKEPIKEEE